MRPNIDAITSRKVRLFLSEHPYRHYGHVSDRTEMLRLESATQVDVFYGLCEELQRPPTQDEFVDRYIQATWREIAMKGADVEEVEARVARAWASYMGELDFYCLLRDASAFDDVILDTDLDIHAGYDVVVIHKGVAHPIHLLFLMDGERSRFWLEQKARRKADVQAKPLEFPLTKDDSDVVGGVHLYTLGHVRRLEEELARAQPAEAW